MIENNSLSVEQYSLLNCNVNGCPESDAIPISIEVGSISARLDTNTPV